MHVPNVVFYIMQNVICLFRHQLCTPNSQMCVSFYSTVVSLLNKQNKNPFEHTTTWVKLVLRVFLPNLENSAVLYSDQGKNTFSISRI